MEPIKNTMRSVDILKSLEGGAVVIIPTDTIPGLAVDATNDDAIAKIYEIKKRDKSKTLPLLFSSTLQVEEYFILSDSERKLADKFWPGGLTLILQPKKEIELTHDYNQIDGFDRSYIKHLPHDLANDAGKIGVRIPANETTRELIGKFGKPIAATSINITGEPSIADLQSIPAEITSKVAGILAGNYKSLGKASTVVEVVEEKIKIYREGAIPIETLKKAIKSF